MQVLPFAVSYHTPAPLGGPGVRHLLKHDNLGGPINITGFGDVVNVIPTSTPISLKEIEDLKNQGFELALKGNLVIIFRPYNN